MTMFELPTGSEQRPQALLLELAAEQAHITT